MASVGAVAVVLAGNEEHSFGPLVYLLFACPCPQRRSLENEVTQLNLKFEAWRAALSSTDTATDVAFQAMHIGERGRFSGRHGQKRLPAANVALLLLQPTQLCCFLNLWHAEFNRELGKTEELCKKLKLVLATIERDRSRFPHVDDRELGLRRTSVTALDRVSARPSL